MAVSDTIRGGGRTQFLYTIHIVINDCKSDLLYAIRYRSIKKKPIMAIPKNVNTFALNLNKITMDDLNRLKVVLVEQKKTGKWLAEQLGVSTTTISRWCSNASQPDLQTLNKIAKVLNVNMKDLLTDNKME